MANNTPRDGLESEIRALERRKVEITAREKELQDPLDTERRHIREKYGKKHGKIDARLLVLRTEINAKAEEEEATITVSHKKPTAITPRVRPRPAASDETMKRRQREVRSVGNMVWERMALGTSCDECVRAGVECYRAIAEKGRRTKWPVFIRGVRYGPCRSCKLERCGCVMEKVVGCSGQGARPATSGPSGSGTGNRGKRSGQAGVREENGAVEKALKDLLTGGAELREIIDSHCKTHKRLLEALTREDPSEVDAKIDIDEDSD
jgi:hypothetical protein